MTAEKIRVYDLAKEIGLSNKETLDLLGDKLNIKLKSHASTVSEEDAGKLKGLLKSSKKVEHKPVEQAKTHKPVQKTVEKAKDEPVEKSVDEKPKKELTKEVSTGSVQSQNIQRDFQKNDRPAGQNYPPRGDRPAGQGNYPPRGDRPAGQGNYPPRGDRPFPPRGDRPAGQGNFPPRGDRPFPPRGDRPAGQGNFPPRGDRPFPPRGDRPAGQGNFPPRGDRPFPPRGDRPAGQGNFPPRGDRPFTPSGDRPFPPRGDRPAGQGNFPPRGDRPFPPRGDRPAGQGNFPPRGDRPFPPRGDRPFSPDGDRKPMPSKQPIKRQFIAPDMMPNSAKGPAKTPKKKDTKEHFGISKEEKEEQARLLQAQKYKKKNKAEEVKEKVSEIIVDKPLTVGELAEKMQVSIPEIVKELMMQGILATVNQTVDVETATKIAEKFEIIILDSTYCELKEDECEIKEPVSNPKNLKPRAPVVTIMGHVDHGKTTLLDSIRAQKHKIVASEVGGITQSIGAYSVKVQGKKIVFIDTPGHEAFTAMRARGAQTTDIVILVVAADDGIMPQTIEAINHAKAAKVPIIIAVNKIDKEGADPERVLTQLTEHGLVPEAWGGDTICQKVSAIQGTGIDELLEYILLVAEMQELKADPTTPASGVVIEAKLDKGKGPVATLLVQRGTLRKGQCIVVGNVGGRIRALLSDEGEKLDKVGPSSPVEILGLSEVPQSGDRFDVIASEKEMRCLVDKRKCQERESRLDSISPSQVRKELIKNDQEETQVLNIIIKANTHGSAEAVSAAVQQLQSKQIFTKIVHIAIGDISEADVMLAAASNAIIIGFSVKEDTNALKCAQLEGIDIRKYDIIYEILEDIEKTMLGLLQPEIKESETGTAEVRQVFSIGKTNKIAGCYVTEGKLIRNKVVSVERGGKQIFKGNLDMLKRFKEDAKEVNSGYECGISFNKFNDLQEGDIIKAYTTQEIERKVLV